MVVLPLNAAAAAAARCKDSLHVMILPVARMRENEESGSLPLSDRYFSFPSGRGHVGAFSGW